MNLFENLQIMNESTNEDFVKQECEKYGITKNSYGTNYKCLYLDPSDEATTEFTNKIEADGYKLIVTQDDGVEGDVSENDKTLVYGKEVEGNRCIIAVSIHPSENSVVVSCGYDEEDGAAEFFESKEPEEIIEWDDDVFDDQYDDGEEKTEASILKDEKDVETIMEQKIIKDEKDIEQIVENKKSLTENSADPKEAIGNKAKVFADKVDALANAIGNDDEIHSFLRSLTNDLDMDVYYPGEPYPSDIDGYFAEPLAALNLDDEDDADMFDWIDNILTDSINKINEKIKSSIEELTDEIAAIESNIEDLKSAL